MQNDIFFPLDRLLNTNKNSFLNKFLQEKIICKGETLRIFWIPTLSIEIIKQSKSSLKFNATSHRFSMQKKCKKNFISRRKKCENIVDTSACVWQFDIVFDANDIEICDKFNLKLNIVSHFFSMLFYIEKLTYFVSCFSFKYILTGTYLFLNFDFLRIYWKKKYTISK